jgi:hypothetical protein
MWVRYMMRPEATVAVESGHCHVAGERVTAYMNLARLFPRNELPTLARVALEAAPGGLDTRGIAPFAGDRGKGPGCQRQALAEGHRVQGRSSAQAAGEAQRGQQGREAAGCGHLAWSPADPEANILLTTPPHETMFEPYPLAACCQLKGRSGRKPLRPLW